MHSLVSLIQLSYASAATRPFSKKELVRLLDISRANNAVRGVTGVLLYAEGTFFQVLEGEEEAVMALFDHIGQDERHGRLVTVVKESIEARAFPEWSMGFQQVSLADLRKHIGLNDLMSTGSALVDITPGRAKQLLSAFRAGRWRIGA